MSIDLSRPLVSSMGHHDPLDALVIYTELEYCRTAHFPDAGLPRLETQITDAARMCAGKSWVSEDPLGIGGLLVDIDRLHQLQAHGSTVSGRVLSQLLADACSGLSLFAGSYPLHAPAEHRLAFRELGLSIGLHAVEELHRRCTRDQGSLTDDAVSELNALMRFVSIAEQIEACWRNPANRQASTWRDHIDINSVMLATSLLPGEFLMV